MAVDLHVHTTASDGSWSPTEVVLAAVERGLSAVAITDHDSIAGIEQALGAALGTGVEVVPGVELSVLGPDGSDAHILGYFVDHHSPEFVAALDQLREARLLRATRMVELLREAGHPLEFAHVARHAGRGAVGRVHVARALVDTGSVESVEEAFARFIGREGPFYVHKSTLEPADAVSLIHDAGGVAVLAHPGISGRAALPVLIEAGLDGIEAFHAEHSPALVREFSEMADRLGLVATGGSDFHAPNMRSALIGDATVPDATLEALRERARISSP